MARLRHLAPLLLSVLLICATGALAVGLTTQATHAAESIHLQDRQSLQESLGSLGRQYVLFSLKEGADYAGTGTWALRPGDVADTARLEDFVTHAVLLNYGAAILDTSSHVLSSYDSGHGLPAPTDPGFAPLLRDLLAGKPDVSSVMRVGGIDVVAMGVPIRAAGRPLAVFVGFVRLDSSPLEAYVRRLHSGRTGQAFVVDSAGTVVAATDVTRIGTRLGLQSVESVIAAGHDGNLLDPRTHDVVAVSAFGVGGWGGLTVQDASEFYGPLRAGNLHIELAIVAMLIVASLLVLILNHKRESTTRRYQARIAYEAAHDGLTGLYNRAVFNERLDQALARARRLGSDVAVLYLDLDRFKQVNDTMAHESGDAVLAEVARRLGASLRASDTAARMGGDEFAVLLEDVASPESLEPVTARILHEIRAPIVVRSGVAQVGVSVGATYAVAGAGDGETLIRRADLAMYRAKDAGGNRVAWAPLLEPVA